MGSVNKVILQGRLGQDPEVRYLNGGGAITTISMATSDRWKDKNTGEQKEKTEWHRVVIFGKLAEVAGEYLRKGSEVYFEGKLQTRKWQDQNGQDRYTTEVVIDAGGTMQMIGSKPQGGGQPQGQGNGQPQGQQGGYSRQAQPGQSQGNGAARPQSAPPVYNEPPMNFDDDIPF